MSALSCPLLSKNFWCTIVSENYNFLLRIYSSCPSFCLLRISPAYTILLSVQLSSFFFTFLPFSTVISPPHNFSLPYITSCYWGENISAVYHWGSSCQLLSSARQEKPIPGRQVTLYTSRGLSTRRRLSERKVRKSCRKLAHTFGRHRLADIFGSDRSAIDSTWRTKPASSRQPQIISSIPTEKM